MSLIKLTFSAMTFKDNQKNIQKKSSEILIKKSVSITDRLRRLLMRKKQQLLEEFDSHPVTQELEAGINSSNVSGTLGGYGNLFSFIGFNEGDKPTEVIRRKIKNIRLIVRQGGGQISYSIISPKIENVFKDTPLPWANRSWARGIETELPHVAKYIHKKSYQKSSRSGRGFIIEEPKRFSTKSKIRRFSNIPYMSKMIKNFNQELQKEFNMLLK